MSQERPRPELRGGTQLGPRFDRESQIVERDRFFDTEIQHAEKGDVLAFETESGSVYQFRVTNVLSRGENKKYEARFVANVRCVETPRPGIVKRDEIYSIRFSKDHDPILITLPEGQTVVASQMGSPVVTTSSVKTYRLIRSAERKE